MIKFNLQLFGGRGGKSGMSGGGGKGFGSVPNPSDPKNITGGARKTIGKAMESAITKMGGELWDSYDVIDVYEFNGNVSPSVVAQKMSDALREKGFHTEKTNNNRSFDVRDGRDVKNNDWGHGFVEVHVGIDDDNSAKGKTFIYVSREDGY